MSIKIIGVFILFIVSLLTVKNINNKKSAFFVPSEIKVRDKILIIFGRIIACTLTVLFLANNNIGNFNN
jgi:hypothetical protein